MPIGHTEHTRIRTLICIILLSNITLAMSVRRKQSDSILELMNIPEIAKLIAQPRLNHTNDNVSRPAADSNHHHSQFYLENDLDEDFSEAPPTGSLGAVGNNKRYRNHNARRQHHHHPNHHQSSSYTPPLAPGFDAKISPSSEDVLVPYNDTLYADPKGEEEMFDLQGVPADKIVKTSKNALYITRKEYLKKDWCKTEPLIQRIREPGCLTRTFLNRFCYGQCNSFYIPKSPKRRASNGVQQNRKHLAHSDGQFDDEDLTGAAFKSCGFCKPKKVTWITVTLRCPSLTPQRRVKRVQRIKQCKCMAASTD